jgi:uncharacterized protein (DUF305 family)
MTRAPFAPRFPGAALLAALALLAPAARTPAQDARPGHAWTAADVHFFTGMIPHHAQAIEMSLWAPTHGASAALRTLAARIINAQQDEIRLMQQWLRDHGQPVPEARSTAMPMMMHEGEHEMLMPGMLTAEQMRQLDQARGPDFDRLFLTFMIQHHRGALTMVQGLFGTEGAGQDNTVFKLASDINVDQTTEVARMQQMLVALVFDQPSR